MGHLVPAPSPWSRMVHIKCKFCGRSFLVLRLRADNCPTCGAPVEMGSRNQLIEPASKRQQDWSR